MRQPARGGAAESGLTLMEMMIVTAMMGVCAYVFTRYVMTTRQSMNRQEASQELQTRDLRSIANLRAGLQGAVLLIGNYSDSTSNAMLTLHNLIVTSVHNSETPTATGAPAPVSFSDWATVTNLATSPTTQDESAYVTNTSSSAWGDEIMYLAALNPITFTAYYTQSGSTWSPGGSSASTATNAEVLSIPRYQFVYDYLTYDTRTAVAGSGNGLRLVEWRSQPVINFANLSDLTDTPYTYSISACCPRLKAACQYLTSTGYTTAFAPANVTISSCVNCWYSLSAESDVYNATSETMTSLSMYSWAFLDDFDTVSSYTAKPGVVVGRISRAEGNSGGVTGGPGSYSVAFNTTGKSSSTSVVQLQGPGGSLTVPAYAVINQGGTGFPGGLELLVSGQIGEREIFMRLVLLASNGANTSPGVFQALQETSEIAIAPQYDF